MMYYIDPNIKIIINFHAGVSLIYMFHRRTARVGLLLRQHDVPVFLAGSETQSAIPRNLGLILCIRTLMGPRVYDVGCLCEAFFYACQLCVENAFQRC